MPGGGRERDKPEPRPADAPRRCHRSSCCGARDAKPAYLYRVFSVEGVRCDPEYRHAENPKAVGIVALRCWHDQSAKRNACSLSVAEGRDAACIGQKCSPVH